MRISKQQCGSLGLAILISSALWLSLCWPMLTGKAVPGFRDSAYLYYPLFEWLDSEWSACAQNPGGWKSKLPLWNPYCNYGMSNLGDNTTSLLYPGKAIFWFRSFAYSTRYGLYISLHILLAGLGTFWLARTLGANHAGATLAAISFAGSGAVLTQATNVIYLVSASWLPFALVGVWRMTRANTMLQAAYWGMTTGSFCALMILGGDPQMVYHIGLIAAATTFSKFLAAKRRQKISPDPTSVCDRRQRQQHQRSFCGLMTLVGVTSILSLVQILPTYQWLRISERANTARPNLYQAVGRAITGQPDLQELIRPLASDSVSFANYEFSLPPWTWIELFIPNVLGSTFPTHQRWSSQLYSAYEPDRVWFLGIYLGWITAWLGLSNLRLFGSGRVTWLSRMLVFFLLGSLGWYGLCWLLPIPHCGAQVAGLYWWMNLLLPGYDLFRYPAKLFVIASLCLCILASLRLHASRLTLLNPFQTLWGQALAVIAILMIIVIQTPLFEYWTKNLPADPLFGPFDVAGSRKSLTWSFMQMLIVLSVFGWLISICSKRQPHKTYGVPFRLESICCWAFVAMTTAELVLANQWILALVPAETFTAKLAEPFLGEAASPVTATTQLKEIPAADSTKFHSSSPQLPLTLYRPGDGFFPANWQSTQSLDRLIEIVLWQRRTYHPKHHLGKGIRLLGSFSSIQPKQYEAWLTTLEAEVPESQEQQKPNQISQQETKTVAGDKQDSIDLKRQLCDGEFVAQNDSVQTRVWNAEPQVIFLRPWGAEQSTISQEIESPKTAGMTDGLELEITAFDSNSISVHARCKQPCQLVHASLFDGHWIAEIEPANAEPQRRRLEKLGARYQGLELPAGEYKIRLRYDPAGFWISAWISLVGWLVVVLLLTFTWLKQRFVTSCPKPAVS